MMHDCEATRMSKGAPITHYGAHAAVVPLYLQQFSGGTVCVCAAVVLCHPLHLVWQGAVRGADPSSRTQHRELSVVLQE